MNSADNTFSLYDALLLIASEAQLPPADESGDLCGRRFEQIVGCIEDAERVARALSLVEDGLPELREQFRLALTSQINWHSSQVARLDALI